jgi:hypothetical protein
MTRGVACRMVRGHFHPPPPGGSARVRKWKEVKEMNEVEEVMEGRVVLAAGLWSARKRSTRTVDRGDTPPPPMFFVSVDSKGG